MKYIVTILVFTFSFTAVWTAGKYSVDIEHLKARKIEVDNTKFYRDGKLVDINIKNKFKEIQEKLRAEKANAAVNPNFEETSPNNYQGEINPFQNENYDYEHQNSYIEQPKQNEVIIDFTANETVLDQEPSRVDYARIAEYKKKSLSRLFSSTSSAISESIEEVVTPAETPLNTDITELTEVTELFDEQVPQLQSSTQLSESAENFNFSKQETLDLNLSASSTNGKTLPNIRLTIENSKGQILQEGSTDIEGNFRKSVTVFTGEKIFVRYYGIGISQEKIEITKEGEE